MSCLSFDYKSDVVNWLRIHGVYNYFIQDSVKRIVNYLKSNKINFTIDIDSMVHITAGLPLATTFDICNGSVVCRTLGELQTDITAWDYYTEQQTLDTFIQKTDSMIQTNWS